jgi:hypothetical protein
MGANRPSGQLRHAFFFSSPACFSGAEEGSILVETLRAVITMVTRLHGET